MVAESEVDLYPWEVLLQQRGYGVQNKELIMTRLVPDVVSRQISSHVHPIKLQRKLRPHVNSSFDRSCIHFVMMYYVMTLDTPCNNHEHITTIIDTLQTNEYCSL